MLIKFLKATYSSSQEDSLALLSRFQTNLTIDINVSLLCMVLDSLFQSGFRCPANIYLQHEPSIDWLPLLLLCRDMIC